MRRKIVAPIMRAAGIPDSLCHPHVLRHTFATLYMQRDGARLEHLQQLMGHASIDTTAQYLHTTATELEADATARDQHANPRAWAGWSSTRGGPAAERALEPLHNGGMSSCQASRPPRET